MPVGRYPRTDEQYERFFDHYQSKYEDAREALEDSQAVLSAINDQIRASEPDSRKQIADLRAEIIRLEDDLNIKLTPLTDKRGTAERRIVKRKIPYEEALDDVKKMAASRPFIKVAKFIDENPHMHPTKIIMESGTVYDLEDGKTARIIVGPKSVEITSAVGYGPKFGRNYEVAHHSWTKVRSVAFDIGVAMVQHKYIEDQLTCPFKDSINRSKHSTWPLDVESKSHQCICGTWAYPPMERMVKLVYLSELGVTERTEIEIDHHIDTVEEINNDY